MDPKDKHPKNEYLKDKQTIIDNIRRKYAFKINKINEVCCGLLIYMNTSLLKKLQTYMQLFSAKKLFLVRCFFFNFFFYRACIFWTALM